MNISFCSIHVLIQSPHEHSNTPTQSSSPPDMNGWTAMLPSFEFMNFVFALIVWSSRYPSVYWNTSKAFAIIFSVQMIVNAIDLLLVFAGVSVIYKLQIVGQKLPLQVSFPFSLSLKTKMVFPWYSFMMCISVCRRLDKILKLNV